MATERPPSWVDKLSGSDEEKFEILELLLKSGNHGVAARLGIKEEMERLAGKIAERIMLVEDESDS